MNAYYVKGTKNEIIIKNTKIKEILLNSLLNELAENIDIISSTAYKVFKMITRINISSDKERIKEIKESFSNIKYDQFIFILNINLKFKELKNLKINLNIQDKFDYLYNSTPEKLAIKSNLIDHQTNWKETTEHFVAKTQQLYII